MMNLFDVVSQDVPLVRTSGKDGGEYHGPCPKCGGEDRFMVWPSAGNYFCRQCEFRGDAIQYLREVRGLSFPDAKRVLGLDVLPYPIRKSPQQRALAQTRAAYRRWEQETSEQLTADYWRLWEAKETTVLRMALLMMQRGKATPEEWEDYQHALDRLQVEEHFLLVEISAVHDPGRLAERVRRWERDGSAKG